MKGLTKQIAEEVIELLKQEYTHKDIFNIIAEDYPSLKLKYYSGAPYVLIRESILLLNK